MYLSLGSSMAVRDAAVIGVFDLDNTTVSRHTRAFLQRVEKDGGLVDVSDDVPKAFVLTSEYGMERVYFTQMSAATLEKRARPRRKR